MYAYIYNTDRQILDKVLNVTSYSQNHITGQRYNNDGILMPCKLSGISSNVAVIDNDYEIGGTIPETDCLPTLKADLLNQADTKKKTVLNAGFMINGTLFDSDINARMAYAELGMRLAENPEYSTAWKTAESTWVTMDAILYAQVKTAGEVHIQSVFAWLANKQAEINAAETIADLQAIVI